SHFPRDFAVSIVTHAGGSIGRTSVRPSPQQPGSPGDDLDAPAERLSLGSALAATGKRGHADAVRVTCRFAHATINAGRAGRASWSQRSARNPRRRACRAPAAANATAK